MNFLKTAFVCGAAAVASVGPAIAIEGDEFVYAKKQTGYLSVAPTDLVPIAASDAANFRSGGSHFTSATIDTRVCGATPLRLPHGAVVQNATMQYSVSGGGSTSVNFTIYRRETFADKAFILPDDYEYLVAESKSDTSGAILRYTEKADQTFAKIDNKNYVYTIRFCTDFGALLYSARVTYTYRNAGQ